MDNSRKKRLRARYMGDEKMANLSDQEKELVAQLRAIHDENDALDREFFAVRDKYKKMAEQEYPYDTWLEKAREISKRRNAIEAKLDHEIVFNVLMRHHADREPVSTDDVRKFPQSLPRDDSKASELSELLVQTCIDYLLAHDDHDIDVVSFGVDGLQSSVPFGEWTPSTDASCTVQGLVQEEGSRVVTRQVIGESI